jgi:hypothetical protein
LSPNLPNALAAIIPTIKMNIQNLMVPLLTNFVGDIEQFRDRITSGSRITLAFAESSGFN